MYRHLIYQQFQVSNGISLELSVDSVLKQRAIENIWRKMKNSLITNTVSGIWRICGQTFWYET